MPQIGRVEISIIEESQSRWLAFQQQGARLHLAAGAVSRQGARRRQAEARSGAAGHRAVSHDRPGHHLYVLQHARSGDRRLQQGEDRAAPRDRDGVRPRTRRSASSARTRRWRSRCRFRPASSATIRIPQHQPLRPRARQQAARLFRLQEGRRRLAHAARRQAADGHYAHRDRRRRPRVQRAVEKVDGSRSASAWSSTSRKFADNVKAAKACQAA